ncbi:hypothetical protein [uncultured Desulfobacter sp.]|uniref:hypothetical protein n=1 Tax=uncultured Desulfobacter sp. TaxID=240139 RepID=UPI0029F4B838|nr:hypothetical protein [uncultured Desulfobacter sp.]
MEHDTAAQAGKYDQPHHIRRNPACLRQYVISGLTRAWLYFHVSLAWITRFKCQQ